MMHLRILLAIAAFLLFSAISACTAKGVIKPPIIVPFAAEKAGTKVEIKVRIVEEHPYSVRLTFLYNEKDPADFKRVIRLTGGSGRDREGRPREPGVPIPLRVSIVLLHPEGEQQIMDQEISQHEVTSWGGGHRHVTVASLNLKPGRYRVSVQTRTDNPALKGTRINFDFVRTYSGK